MTVRKTLGGTLIFSLLVGLVLIAEVPKANADQAESIQVCINKILGTVRVSSSKQPCTKLETSLTWNITGPQGIRGIPGVQGIPGVPGIQGVPGVPGIQGVPGVPGTPGVQGIQGIQGIQGAQGVQGPSGIIGLENKNCGPGDGVVTGFDAQGAPTCGCKTPFTAFTTTNSIGATQLTNISINGVSGAMATVAPGAQVVVSLNYNDQHQAGYIVALQGGWSHGQYPAGCFNDGSYSTPPFSGSGSITLTAPTLPGTYYIGTAYALDYSCTPTWWYAPTNHIAAICVK